MKPFRQSFSGFDKELPALRKMLSQGPMAEHLERAVHGKLLEGGAITAGQLEIRRRRRKHKVRNSINLRPYRGHC